MTQFLTLSDWKAKAAVDPACQEPLYKYFTPDEVKAVGEPSERMVQFTISTASVDRDRDVINPKGWDVTNYLKGGPGPVLLAHDYKSLPIGKAPRVWVEGDALKSAAQICTADEHPLGEYVYRQLLGGFLKSASVGFRPIEAAYDAERDGYNFQKQELLEYSLVAVPAQPDAIIGAKSLGLDLAPLKAWAEEFLDTFHEEKGLWLPKSQVEAAFKLLETKTISIPAPATAAKTAEGDGIEKEAIGIQLDENGEAEGEVTLGKAAEQTVTKVGRVLSAMHEAHLRTACDNIQKVLAALDAPDDPMQMAADESTTKAAMQSFDDISRVIAEAAKLQAQEFITSLTGRVF